ncbi:MAG: sugar phosphate isomerase/epimerase [Armatimonadaceae bacterium]
MKLGIQTIIFGQRSREDLPGVLTAIKNAGYDGLEFGMRDATPEETKALFSQHGLVCCGYHSGYGGLADLENAKKQAEHLVGVGGKYLMCSGTDGRERDGYLRSAEVFNQVGKVLSEIGVHFCYHNHNWEFFDLGNGETGMDILLANTDPAVVKLCPDIYWLACGGQDPAAFVRQHRERAVYFHYKDGTFDPVAQQPQTFTELGRGQVDLKSAHKAVLELNPEWVVTEQDRTDGEPAESAKISADYARTELGI